MSATTFEQAAESAVATLSSQGASAPPATPPSPSTSEGQGQEGSAGGFVGIDGDQPGESNNQPLESGGTTPSGEKDGLAPDVKPELIVATIGGKPVTAQELLSGNLRHADYTRKTQELAETRAKYDNYVPFIDSNLSYIEDIVSGDPARLVAALSDIANNQGQDLAQLVGKASGQSRSANGQFASAKAEKGFFDLEEFDEGSESHAVAVQANAAIQEVSSRLDKIEAASQNFQNGLSQKMAQAQNVAQADAIASKWEQARLPGIDVEGALALVGKQMTVEQAMKIHHFENILRHNVGIARGQNGQSAKTPNEPGGQSRPAGSMAGKSLAQVADERFAGT